VTTDKKPRGPRGEGTIYWDAKRQRFIAEATIGYTPAGKRIMRRASGKTRTEARTKLREINRDKEDGVVLSSQAFTVAQAVEDWLSFGLTGRSPNTIQKYGYLCRAHIIPALGRRRLRDLGATDIDRWLAGKVSTLSTSTLRTLRECLSRAVDRAMARDLVKRNIVKLCGVPRGQDGRQSKALTFAQAKAVLAAAELSPLYAYIALSLLVGARTEELRALTWDHVDLDGRPDANAPRPPSIEVWRSVRDGGDTKTKKSRRTLALPLRAVSALGTHREWQAIIRQRAADRWADTGLVFTTRLGTQLDAGNVRKQFRQVVTAAGLDGTAWTPRELRHSFVSLLSDRGMRIEDIADLVGHAGTRVTEAVYRQQLRPMLLNGAVTMDEIFGPGRPDDAS